MAELQTLSVTGAAAGSQDASLPGQFVRLSQMLSLFSGCALKNHTHTASQITDFGAAVNAILGAYDFPNDVILSPGGGIVEVVDGLRIDSGVVSLIGHTHVSADITNFDTSVLATLQNQLKDTASIKWGFSAGQFSGVVKVTSGGGLKITPNGVEADFGTTSTTIARGDHTHTQLHDALTLAASNTLTLSLATQQLTAEAKLKAGGGIIYDGDGLKLDSGVVAGFAGESGSSHDAATVVNSTSLSLSITAGQVLSGALRVDANPGAGRGKLALDGNGVVVVLGTDAQTAAAGNHTHTAATPSADGFISAEDKTKLDALTEGLVSVQTNAPFFRELPAISGEYLMGQYAWQSIVYLRSATVNALAGLTNTLLELEVDGILTGRTVTVPSGVANAPVTVTQSLFDYPLTAGKVMRFKITGAAAPEDAHSQMGLSVAMVQSSVEPEILLSGVTLHPTGGLVQTSEGLAVAHLLEDSNYRFKDGQLQLWDPDAYIADSTKPWRALGISGGQLILSAPITN